MEVVVDAMAEVVVMEDEEGPGSQQRWLKQSDPGWWRGGRTGEGGGRGREGGEGSRSVQGGKGDGGGGAELILVALDRRRSRACVRALDDASERPSSLDRPSPAHPRPPPSSASDPIAIAIAPQCQTGLSSHLRDARSLPTSAHGAHVWPVRCIGSHARLQLL